MLPRSLNISDVCLLRRLYNVFDPFEEKKFAMQKKKLKGLI